MSKEFPTPEEIREDITERCLAMGGDSADAVQWTMTACGYKPSKPKPLPLERDIEQMVRLGLIEDFDCDPDRLYKAYLKLNEIRALQSGPIVRATSPDEAKRNYKIKVASCIRSVQKGIINQETAKKWLESALQEFQKQLEELKERKNDSRKN